VGVGNLDECPETCISSKWISDRMRYSKQDFRQRQVGISLVRLGFGMQLESAYLAVKF